MLQCNYITMESVNRHSVDQSCLRHMKRKALLTVPNITSASASVGIYVLTSRQTDFAGGCHKGVSRINPRIYVSCQPACWLGILLIFLFLVFFCTMGQMSETT